MPKCNWINNNDTQRTKPANKEVTGKDKIIPLVRGYADAQHKTYRDIAEMIGCSAGTVTARLKHPEDFTLGEIISLGNALGIPKDELRQVINY